MADTTLEHDPCGECGHCRHCCDDCDHCEKCDHCGVHDPEVIGRVKDSWLWIKDSKGYGSVTVTFITIAFFVTTLAYMLSIVESIGPVHLRAFDVAACSAYFIPILTLYFGRRWTEAKYDTNGNAGK